MPRGKPNPKPSTLPIPPDWRDHFKGATMRTSFVLSLTRPMLEFLCAVADDVLWDRAMSGVSCQSRPDHYITCEQSLIKRGLIERKSREELGQMLVADYERVAHPAYSRLTPAGVLMVEMLKITGLFIEADAAIAKKHKRA